MEVFTEPVRHSVGKLCIINNRQSFNIELFEDLLGTTFRTIPGAGGTEQRLRTSIFIRMESSRIAHRLFGIHLV